MAVVVACVVTVEVGLGVLEVVGAAIVDVVGVAVERVVLGLTVLDVTAVEEDSGGGGEVRLGFVEAGV